MDMIQHLKTCKTVMAEQRSCGRADLGKPVHREEYGEKMVFKYQLGLLTAKNQNEILSLHRKKIYPSGHKLRITFLLEDVWSVKMKHLNPSHPLLHKKILRYDFH